MNQKNAIVFLSLLAIFLLINIVQSVTIPAAVELNRELCIHVTKKAYDKLKIELQEKEKIYQVAKEDYNQLLSSLKAWMSELELVNKIINKSSNLRDHDEKSQVIEMLEIIKRDLENSIKNGKEKLAAKERRLGQLHSEVLQIKQQLEKALTRVNTCMFIEMTLKKCSFDIPVARVSLQNTPTYNVHFNDKFLALAYKGPRVAGRNVDFSDEFIPVDTSKKYVLSCEIASIGSNPSRVYVGLANYDSNKKFIRAFDVLRTGIAGTVVEVSDKKIIVKEELEGWNPPERKSHTKSIGIYIDGDTSNLPDFVHTFYKTNDPYSLDIDSGAFSFVEDNEIFLNSPIPGSIKNKIKPGVTKVMNHYSGGTYQYIATRGSKMVPHTMTKYTSAIITGEQFGNKHESFRPYTKFVKLMILPNYKQDDTFEFVIKNIRFEEVE